MRRDGRASRPSAVAWHERGLLPEVAERIIRRREARGPFRDEADLYEVVRDNEIRMDQLLGIVGLPARDNPQGYST